jgi:hypothetical protein
MRFAWVSLFALGLFVGPANSAEDRGCTADGALSYVCGLQKPEDVLAIPGTDWLVASGFSKGAGLKLVDASSRSFRLWYTGAPEQFAPDPRRFPHCPGPLDPALFNARGLSLREIGPRRWQLLVVNHGGRESVEIFEIDANANAPQLRWKGCLPMPEGQVGNSVASFADGTVLVTVLTRPGTSIADFVEGRVTGGVWQWRRGASSFALMPGTELPGNNGLETDPDGNRFYVVAFGWHAVVIFDRRNTVKPLVVTAPDFMPDNIHWSAGRLLLAGMRYDEPACGGLRVVVDGKADPMLCHRGWVVGELDPKRHRIATVAYGRPEPGFNGVSAAAQVGGMLWLGSFQSDRLAIVREPGPGR